MYIKDWHLALQLEQRNKEAGVEEEASFYETPGIFKDDWMNRYYRAKTEDDFRFVVRLSSLLLRLVTDAF